MAARQLTKLKIKEVSSVDAGANKGAVVMLVKRDISDGNYPSSITKRDFSADQRKELADTGAAMPDGGYPIETKADLENAIHAVGRAKNAAKVKSHIQARARALDATDALPESWGKRDSGTAVMAYFSKLDRRLAKYGDGEAIDFDTAQAQGEESETVNALIEEVNEAVCALSSSLWTIFNDKTIEDKDAAVQESLNQFGEHVKTVVPEGVENAFVAQALANAGYHLNPQGGIELAKRSDSDMTKAIAKALGLSENATEAEVVAALAKKDADAKFATNVVKMSADHKAFMDHPKAKLPEGGKEKFAEMAAADRTDHIASNPLPAEDEDDVEKSIRKGDAFRSKDGVILTKRDFGSAAGFQFAKSQAEEIAKAFKENADLRDEQIRKSNVEKAGALVHIGKADEVGGLLFDIAKHDPKLADRVEALLKAANEAITKGALFTEIGRTVTKAGSAVEQINKLAQDAVAKDSKLTIEKARTAVRKGNPELAAREAEEAKSAR